MASFLRWCANQDKLLSNINDLEAEKSDKKIIYYTVKWKNIEWTFDCSPNDFKGHEGRTVNFPHFHFQMRIDGRQFINVNDFHIPDKPIPGELIDEIRRESIETGKSMSLIAKDKLAGIANVQTVISPAENIPDITARSEHKRR
jgi:hypothetical protein